MQSLDACTPWVAAPQDVRATGPEPGPVLMEGGTTSSLDELPELADSSLVLWTAAPASRLEIARVVARETGMVVFDFYALGLDSPTPSWGIRSSTISDLVTLLYLNAPRTPSSRMGYTFLFEAIETTSTERLLLHRSVRGRILDLDVYFAGGGGWTTHAGTPRQLERAIEQAHEMLALADIAIGDVRLHDIVGALRDKYEIVDGDELEFLFQLSAGARRPSVHLFLVRALENAIGLSSGIPGAQVMPGTGASGVAVAVDLVPHESLLAV